MSYDDDELVEEKSFRSSDDEEEPLEPIEGMSDFGLDEEDPDKDS